MELNPTITILFGDKVSTKLIFISEVMRAEQTTARIAVKKSLLKQQSNWLAITARHEAENDPLQPLSAGKFDPQWAVPPTLTVPSTPLQVPSPSLADEVLSEALHLFLFDQLKTGFLV